MDFAAKLLLCSLLIGSGLALFYGAILLAISLGGIFGA